MAFRTKRAAHLEELYEWEQLQIELEQTWFDQSLPDDWTGMDFLN